MHMRGMIQASQKLARTTHDCESICVQTIQYCLQLGGAHVESSHLQLMMDCADICEPISRMASRYSRSQIHAAAACADICELCAASCEKFVGDAQMKACANECLLCAAACRETARVEVSPGAHPHGFAGTMPQPR